MSKSVHIHCNVDEGTHRVLSVVADDEDRTLGRQVARVLREWANQQVADGNVEVEA